MVLQTAWSFLVDHLNRKFLSLSNALFARAQPFKVIERRKLVVHSVDFVKVSRRNCPELAGVGETGSKN